MAGSVSPTEVPSRRGAADFVAEDRDPLAYRVAVRFGNREITYRELELQSARLARRLLRMGVTAGDRVAIALERSMFVPIAIRAVLRTGAAYVPLDPTYPDQCFSFMFRDSDPRMVLTQKSLLDRIAPLGRPVLLADEANLDDEDIDPLDPLDRDAALPDESRLDGSAYIVYTSGSTGQPKGIPFERRAIANLIEWQCRDSAADSTWRTLQFSPLSFDIHYQELFSTWATGGTVVLVDEETRVDPVKLLALIEHERIARIFMPLQHLEGLAEIACLHRKFPTCLREVITAGEQLRITPTLRSFFSRLPDCSLHNQYGASETHVVTSYDLPRDPAEWPVLPPIGRPLPGVEVQIIDERGAVAEIDRPGELYVGGVPLGTGYFRRPELTAERFVNVAGRRCYRMGDQVRRRADGNLEFLGRLDDQVKIRGNRVEPGEIEVHLLEHPGVANCAVALRGERGVDERLVGYWVPRPESTQTTAVELRQFLHDRLPSHMVPSDFVRLESLPKSPSGKLDRRALPAPSGARSNWDGKYVAPRNELERQLAAIWADLLGIECVGISDNFFEFGGDSILATRHMIRLEKELGHSLPMADLFRGPTIEQIAAQIRRSPCAPPDSSLISIQPGGANPPFFWVPGASSDRAVFFSSPSVVTKLSEHLGLDQPVYAFCKSYSKEPAAEPLTIERIAESFVRDIRSLQPTGPYFLGGWSFGGNVAFAMAEQLRAQGEVVGLLALLDTVGPGYPQRRPWREQVRWHLRKMQGLGFGGRLRYLATATQERTQLIWLNCRELAAKLMGRRPFSRMESEYFADRASYPGPVVLFMAESTIAETEDKPWVSFDPLFGWRPLIDGAISVHRVPGDHGSIFEEPGVAQMAERLREHFAESTARRA
jgi:amino acid adenylation domain-containing protein